MERSRLQHEIGDISSASKDIIDELKNVATSVSKIVAAFEAASKRCCDLTEGRFIILISKIFVSDEPLCSKQLVVLAKLLVIVWLHYYTIIIETRLWFQAAPIPDFLWHLKTV